MKSVLRRPGSLFWSLTGSILAVLLLTALAQWLLVWLVIQPVARSWQNSQAQDLVEQVAPALEEQWQTEGPPAVRPVLARYQSLTRAVILVFETPDGRRIFPPGRRHSGRRRGPSPADPARAQSTPVASQEIRVDGQIVGTLLAMRPPGAHPVLDLIPLRGILLLPGVLLGAALAGMWIFRRLQRRLRALENHAVRVGEGDLTARISDPGRDELGRVAHELNLMTERLAAARAEVEAVDAQRRQLFQDITHELSTPLTSVRGYAETLMDQNVPVDSAERARFLQNILHASERMNLLLRDLMDLARIEAGAIELRPEPLDLVELVAHSVERLRPDFSAAQMELRAQLPATPVVVRADGLRLEQVVDNLLHNALRHGVGGREVVLEVAQEAGRARIEVRDRGPGFPEAALPHVFERFYRPESSRSREGSGLGLAIVREIVVQHGGEISAANRPGGGAVLRAWLPLEPHFA